MFHLYGECTFVVFFMRFTLLFTHLMPVFYVWWSLMACLYLRKGRSLKAGSYVYIIWGIIIWLDHSLGNSFVNVFRFSKISLLLFLFSCPCLCNDFPTSTPTYPPPAPAKPQLFIIISLWFLIQEGEVYMYGQSILTKLQKYKCHYFYIAFFSAQCWIIHLVHLEHDILQVKFIWYMLVWQVGVKINNFVGGSLGLVKGFATY